MKRHSIPCCRFIKMLTGQVSAALSWFAANFNRKREIALPFFFFSLLQPVHNGNSGDIKSARYVVTFIFAEEIFIFKTSRKLSESAGWRYCVTLLHAKEFDLGGQNGQSPFMCFHYN